MSFRRSKIAILLDILLLPLMIPYGILMQGLPDTWLEIKCLPRSYGEAWKTGGWFVGQPRWKGKQQ